MGDGGRKRKIVFLLVWQEWYGGGSGESMTLRQGACILSLDYRPFYVTVSILPTNILRHNTNTVSLPAHVGLVE